MILTLTPNQIEWYCLSQPTCAGADDSCKRVFHLCSHPKRLPQLQMSRSGISAQLTPELLNPTSRDSLWTGHLFTCFLFLLHLFKLFIRKEPKVSSKLQKQLIMWPDNHLTYSKNSSSFCQQQKHEETKKGENVKPLIDFVGLQETKTVPKVLELGTTLSRLLLIAGERFIYFFSVWRCCWLLLFIPWDETPDS